MPLFGHSTEHLTRKSHEHSPPSGESSGKPVVVTLGLTAASHALRTGDGWVCVTLSGEFDFSSAATLEAWLSEDTAELPPGTRVTLDFTRTIFCDAGCTAVLTRHYYRLIGLRVEAVGVRGTVARVFAILGLSDLLSGRNGI